MAFQIKDVLKQTFNVLFWPLEGFDGGFQKVGRDLLPYYYGTSK